MRTEGSVEPASAATSVDFPDPVGPATQVSSPGGRANVTPSTARVGALCPIRSITRSVQSITWEEGVLRGMLPSSPGTRGRAGCDAGSGLREPLTFDVDVSQ